MNQKNFFFFFVSILLIENEIKSRARSLNGWTIFHRQSENYSISAFRGQNDTWWLDEFSAIVVVVAFESQNNRLFLFCLLLINKLIKIFLLVKINVCRFTLSCVIQHDFTLTRTQSFFILFFYFLIHRSIWIALTEFEKHEKWYLNKNWKRKWKFNLVLCSFHSSCVN